MTTNSREMAARLAELQDKHDKLVMAMIPFAFCTLESTCEFLFVKFKVLRIEDNTFATLAEIKEVARQQLADELGEGVTV